MTLTQSAKTYPITVDVVADGIVELPEDFTITLTGVTTALPNVAVDATPGAGQAVGTITNMDIAVASVSSTAINVTEAEDASVDITVSIDLPIQSGARVEVGYDMVDETANAMAD